MGEIFVVVEHRQGEVRNITFEMLFKAGELCKLLNHKLTAILFEGKGQSFESEISMWADTVLVFEDERFRDFDADTCKEIINSLIKQHRPFITLIGHTSWGIDLAPALSVKSGYPIATDCVDIMVEGISPKVIRQMYGGKVFCSVSFKESDGYLITVRPGAFIPAEGAADRQADVIRMDIASDPGVPKKDFVEFVDTGAGELDISQAEFLVSIGRGIGEKENIEAIKELADTMGGTLSCSRPIVDMNWLPKYHQVGTSAKSVRPKVYLALGISGAFQHVAGISGAQTVIAVNKDKKAPIFRVSDYGVVDDLFIIADALKEKLKR
jgi:electron transfer flavoprotein alpha subunit